MADLQVGLVGCGNISGAYLSLAPRFQGLAIVAVADLDDGAAQAKAAEHGVRALAVDALLAATDIDCVVNLTIPAAHAEVTCAALAAGKHVYSEKPLALDMEQANRIAALAAEHKVRVGCAPDTFLGGSHQLARAQLDAGRIGTVTSGTCHVMSPGMEMWHPNPDFFYQPGAGPVLDIGPYYITNLVNLLGPVNRVVAMANTPQAERTITSAPRAGEKVKVNTPTTLHAILDFASGAKVTLGASWDVHAHRHGNMELYGSTGSMYVPDPNFFDGPVVVATGAGAEELPATDHPLGVANWDHPDGTKMANHRSAGLADMALAIAAGDEHRCSLERAMHCLEVMTGILAAAASGTEVTLTTTCTRPAPLPSATAAAMIR